MHPPKEAEEGPAGHGVDGSSEGMKGQVGRPAVAASTVVAAAGAGAWVQGEEPCCGC